MKHSSGVLVFAVILCVALGMSAQTKKQKSDWTAYFGVGIAPPYPMSGKLIVSMSNDQHYSYTDSNGQTSSVHCSTNSTGADCQEGSGLYYYLVMPDDSSIYVSPFRLFEADSPLSWQIVGGNALLDVPVKEQGSHIFHFRWVDSPIGGHVLCVQLAGVESIPNGKELKEYAKHHRMETCYFANESKWHPKVPAQ